MDVQEREAARALIEAAEALGLTAAVAAGQAVGDVVLFDDVGRQLLVVEVKWHSVVDAASAGRVGAAWPGLDGDVAHLVVADRVTDAARQVLRESGVGFLDLRGHLRLAACGLLIDADVPAVRPRPQRSEALSGRAGLEVACWLLTHPGVQPSVRRIARDLARSASTVSEVLKAMRGQNLVGADNAPAVPELFWETAAAWRPHTVALAGPPQPGSGPTSALLELGLEHPASGIGWTLGESLAAAAYGAPIVVTGDYPPEFYVPSRMVARRAEQFLHRAPDWRSRGAVVRIAPVPAVCAHRIDAPEQVWPLVHPVFAALDLSLDPARGREILEGWTPPEPWQRVW